MLSINKKDSEADTIIARHAVICDGYRETESNNQWHINFGWGEYSPDFIQDAWYILPDQMPSGYSVIKYGLMNIYPPIIKDTTPNSNQLELVESYPNPFTESYEIVYSLPQGSQINISIYDALGRRVRSWSFNHASQGVYGILWNGKDYGDQSLPAAVYYIQVADAKSFETGKVILFK